MSAVLALLIVPQVELPPRLPVADTVHAAQSLTPPADWSMVPPLPWRVEPQTSPELSAFVRRTIAVERCPIDDTRVTVPVAVFLRPDGLPRAVVPWAINCSAVEQFAAGLVSTLVRNNVRMPASGWYRTTITFDWTR